MLQKLWILSLSFWTTIAVGQEVALLDRSFKAPIVYTDSLTLNMMEEGAFPLYVQDAAALINYLNAFARIINSYSPGTVPTEEKGWGHTQLYTYTKQVGSYKNYQLVLKTITPTASTALVVINEHDPLPLAIEKLNRMTAYIRNYLSIKQTAGGGELNSTLSD